MKINFDEIQLNCIPQFYCEEKELQARMYRDTQNKILYGKLEPEASIGYHKHETSSEIIYILSGTAKVLYDDGEEVLVAGECHYCPKGHSHSLINQGKEDLVFFAVVPEQ